MMFIISHIGSCSKRWLLEICPHFGTLKVCLGFPTAHHKTIYPNVWNFHLQWHWTQISVIVTITEGGCCKCLGKRWVPTHLPLCIDILQLCSIDCWCLRFIYMILVCSSQTQWRDLMGTAFWMTVFSTSLRGDLWPVPDYLRYLPHCNCS